MGVWNTCKRLIPGQHRLAARKGGSAARLANGGKSQEPRIIVRDWSLVCCGSCYQIRMPASPPIKIDRGDDDANDRWGNSERQRPLARRPEQRCEGKNPMGAAGA